jgi:hypothetical protein
VVGRSQAGDEPEDVPAHDRLEDLPAHDGPEDVLAHDDLAREYLALGQPERPLGLIRRMAAGSTGGGTFFSVFEEIYAPTRHEANLAIEAQRLVGAPAPAPTDPPALEPVGRDGELGKFRGRVVIRKAPAADPPAG